MALRRNGQGDTLEIGPTICDDDHSLALYAVFLDEKADNTGDIRHIKVILETKDGMRGSARLSPECRAELFSTGKGGGRIQWYLPSDINLLSLSAEIVPPNDD